MKGRLTLAVLAVAALLTVAVVGGMVRFMDPFPPRRIVLATGQADGVYDAFGRQYQARLAREGLRVDLLRTAGAVENLERLLRGQVDVAFVQGGTYHVVSDPEGRLRGMAALYREPLWIFYRGRPVTDGLASLAGRRIAIGATGSGTEVVSRALLGGVGLPSTGPNLLTLPSAEARRQLEEGRIDAAFFVSSYREPNVDALLHRPDVRLLSFRREEAFAGNFRYLSPIHIAEGLLDLKSNLPREETMVMAPAALLVCQQTLHPRVVEQILSVARELHGAGSLLDPPRQFPTRQGVDVPLHDAAESFLARGESFLSRILPYWALRLVVQGRVILLPLLAVWLPLFKILPWVIRWRGNRILERHYALLRDAEAAVVSATRPELLREAIAWLETVRARIDSLTKRLPLQHQRDVYHCRMHASMVLTEARDRLRFLLQDGGGR